MDKNNTKITGVRTKKKNRFTKIRNFKPKKKKYRPKKVSSLCETKNLCPISEKGNGLRLEGKEASHISTTCSSLTSLPMNEIQNISSSDVKNNNPILPDKENCALTKYDDKRETNSENELMRVVNKFREVFYMQRIPLKDENKTFYTGFLFLSSQSLHWGEILTMREVFVIEGSCSILFKDSTDNLIDEYSIEKGENFVLYPGCFVELHKDDYSKLLKLFIVYLQ